MPEGPEIKYLNGMCETYLLGYNLVDIKSNSKDTIKIPENMSKLISIISKGKLLVFVFGNIYLHIHFGLTGWFVFENPDYPKYELIFKKNDKILKIYVDDKIKFSKLKFYDEDKHLKAINKLGVDIFSIDFTYKYFESCTEKTNKKIVSFLLDQNKFSGIGNYIKNESLYIAKIDPYRTTSDLDKREIKLLYDAIKFCAYSNCMELLKQNKDIKSDKNFINLLKSVKPEIPYKYRVYQQEKDPDGNNVTAEEISGRKTYYVKKIQQ